MRSKLNMRVVQLGLPKNKKYAVLQFTSLRELTTISIKIKAIHRRHIKKLCRALAGMNITHRMIGNYAVEFDESALTAEQRSALNYRLRHVLEQEYKKIGLITKQKPYVSPKS